MIDEKRTLFFCFLSEYVVLAGETMPDEGSAYICGHSMQREMAKARQLVGYCPQFDALAGTLTGQQDLLLSTPPPQLHCLGGTSRVRQDLLICTVPVFMFLLAL